VQRSSPSIGSLAAALAKAQAELVNPEKSLAATIHSEGTGGAEQTFRYAPLSSGLDIVCKTLGQHEIATVQTTAVDQTSGIINLTTVLAHSSGEWIASDWPVCAIADTATPHRMGAALTYARRYALFTLVGIAGEDDLDAPDLGGRTVNPGTTQKPAPAARGRLNGGSGAIRHRPAAAPSKLAAGDRPPHGLLEPMASAALLERILIELQALTSADEATTWAHRVLGAKNSLIAADVRRLEDAFEAKLAMLEGEAAGGDAQPMEGTPELQPASSPGRRPRAPLRVATAAGIDKSRLARPEPRRIRDKDHVRFVAKQPCLICGRAPADAHHLRFAQHRALGRKPSDEFTVPLCRGHHREVHRSGDEAAWWAKAGIDPTGNARSLWLRSHPLLAAATGTEVPTLTAVAAAGADPRRNELDQSIGQRGPNYETKPIITAGPQ
jgi:ERF superfamily